MKLKTIFTLIVFIKMCVGSKVLVVFPVPSRTDSVLGESIVRTLLDGGHKVNRMLDFRGAIEHVVHLMERNPHRGDQQHQGVTDLLPANTPSFLVTYVTPAPRETTTSLRYVNISSVLDDVTDKNLLDMVELLDRPPPASSPLQRGVAFAEKALQHEAVQQLLRLPTESFDVVIADWYYSGLLAPLASLYDCPLIWYSSSDLHWQSLRLVHEASSPAFTVDQNSQGLPEGPFSTWDRAHQLWLQVYLTAWSYYLTNYVEVPAYRNLYHDALSIRGRLTPEYEPLVYNASMLLVNSYPPLGQMIPLPHNVKYIGGHHIELAIKPLPVDLKRVLDKAEDGVIFFSVESNLPEKIKYELVDLFRRLEQTVIWDTVERLEQLPRNLHLIEEAPKISILSHRNTIMVITHGDLPSLMEAAHCGVPVIGIPVFGDQFVNVDLAVSRGWAVRVNYSKHLPQKLNEAVNEIIGDFSYKSNAKLVSSMFRRRTTPAHTELLHWVQLVVDTKGAHHLWSPARHIKTTDRLYLDILIAVLAVLWFLSKVLKVIRVHLRDEDLEKKYQ